MLIKNERLKNKIFFALIFISFIFLTAMYHYGKVHGTVVCFGDSITHGALVDGHSWVYFLSKDHIDINFINEGRNGRKTSDKEEVLPVLKKYSDADFFLIFLGVNDLKNGNDTMVNSCVENMKWMIKKIKETNKKTKIVVFAPSDISLQTMTPLNVGKKYNENTKSSLIKLAEKYKELSMADSLGFVSLLKTVSQENYVDGVHPNEKGQQQIAKAVWKGLSELYP
jgi:acyl-CoA thioesterase I